MLLKRLIAAIAAATLMTSPVAAAAPAAVPAEETIDGLSLFDSYASPLIMFLLIVGVGTGIALLVDTGDDEPSSP
jgi:hypothetical protein